ncbi:MAG: hypothetical protein IJR43_02555 [Synergistaceae bacterium]|nr:hypothetical protein [Synergistaceae bacterium]
MKKLTLSVLVIMLLAGIISCAYAEEAPSVFGALTAQAEEAAPAAEEAAPAESAEGEFDFLRFAKERVLQDFHPTAKPENAEVQFDEKPFDKGDGITRARVGIYYSGWVRQHSMLIDMDYRKEDRQIKISLIKDTNSMNIVGNRFFKEGEWVSIAAMGWK